MPESIFCCCSNLYKDNVYIANIKISPKTSNILVNIVKPEEKIPSFEGIITNINK